MYGINGSEKMKKSKTKGPEMGKNQYTSKLSAELHGPQGRASDHIAKQVGVLVPPAPDRPAEAMGAGPGICPHCYQSLPDPKPLIAHDGLEVQGLLRAIEPAEDNPDFIIATIGALRVVYSADKEKQLRPLWGQQIASIMNGKKLVVMRREGWMRA
jgi:hypothetical protein